MSSLWTCVQSLDLRPVEQGSGVPLGMADAGGGHGFCQTGVVLYRPVATRQPFVITADHGILPEPSL
ncbi:hypothetical protein [Enterobacter hormaechei]|uniref:hypothetical protein n=1 Tax=Enterobacter hormaechei TaxID=158836 RepID=UPI001EF049BF|nr:hypothetical protein [Enterobacter hormaechei]